MTATIGHFALFLALCAAAWATVASWLSTVASGRGLQKSAERGVYAAFGAIAIAVLCLEIALVTDDFRLDAVFHYSSAAQALPYKIGALWGSQAGSLLLWSFLLGGMASITVATNRTKNRALMPWVVTTLGIVLTFFLILVNVVASPFAAGPMRADGVGLNPQLKNYWMMIHPPTLYLGYVGFTIPFAFAIAALATRRTGDIWFRTTRRWTIFAWFFLGTGILMGSYWAYIELGWGGYWAWDPVENASLMPWLTGTAFLHSVMIQEKKGMMKVWNVTLILLTFCLSIFGTFLTRSGIISSVHSFATSDIGPAFAWFLGIVFFGSLLLLILRLPDLSAQARLESVLSREASFLFNNMVLVGIAATVLFLTTFPLISEAATGRKVTMGPPIFNIVNIPWALVLLFLIGVGPLIAWRKATAENLRRNFLLPGLTGLWMFLLFVVLEGRAAAESLSGMGRALASLDAATFLDRLKAFYPPICFGLAGFVLATVVIEYSRAVAVRRRQYGENGALALARLVGRNRRRWGGYVVHVGVVIVFVGIAASSAYRKETVELLEPKGTMRIDGYAMTYDGYRLEAVDDHVAAITELSIWQDGRFVGRLEAAQRWHPNMLFPELRTAFHDAVAARNGDPETRRTKIRAVFAQISRLERSAGREVKTPSTEVAIHKSFSLAAPHRFGEDFYVTPLGVDPVSGTANFRIFVNPLVNFLWMGGLVFVLGATICILPDSRERRRLEASMALEDRAAA
ncbi:MAG TPA: cytochrome c-type biogenesis CcmF C-terminal domain-containing protein [Candidatus Polarisedimenticolaceae bacterium]|nr:cytochrome c-type biogenesis CcmF C-terminal domain-containing protein [Candidatus Polarisedimenticolaceae bacterium]